MEVINNPDQNSNPNVTKTNEKMENYKENLFLKLAEYGDSNIDKCLSQVLFIQAMFKQDLSVLIKLFDFCLVKDQIKMSADILFNHILKNFNLNQVYEFDHHLNKFCLMILKNSRIKKSPVSQALIDKLGIEDEIFYQLFQSLDTNLQELLVVKILDKYRHNFNKYVKLFIESDKKSTPVQPSQQHTELKDFYINFAHTYQYLYLIKDILFIYKKFAQEYGLYLIDTFLNIEKHMHTFLVQNAVQFKLDPSLISIERRSLNLIRRFCVLDLIHDFSVLIDKLDNRHCYRWIEKCLEFFTKYSICSTRVSIESNIEDRSDTINIHYSSIKLLDDSEILVNDSTESNEKFKHDTIEEIKEKLKDMIEFRFESVNNELTPYSSVYKLLDEIGKKLEWPTVPETHQHIQDKMAFLFAIKQKPDKQVSISALNKQISFYGLTFFFNNLTEFQACNKNLFNDQLMLVPGYKWEDQCNQHFKANLVIEKCISNIIFCVKIWQKFNQHKEYYTIVTKCLSNSKLDSLTCYKNFLADYYSSFQLGINQPSQNSNYNWTNLANLSIKQKISVISYLFKKEDTSFKTFFDEIAEILKYLKLNEISKSGVFAPIILSKNFFYLIELNCKNFLQYVCGLIVEKLWNLVDSKRMSSTALLKHDQYLLVLLIIVQYSGNSKLKDFLIKTIQSKQSLDFKEFFDYIFDVSILQDVLVIINQSDKATLNDKFKLGQDDSNLNDKFLLQINTHLNPDQVNDKFLDFFSTNITILQEIFDKISSI